MKPDFNTVKNSPEIRTYITQADASLLALGYTEHSFAHVTKCAELASSILAQLDYVPAAGGAGPNCRIYARHRQRGQPRWTTPSRGARDGLPHPRQDGHGAGGDRHRDHRHRQSRRGHRLPGQRRGRGAHPGGQDRRAPHPRAQPGHRRPSDIHDRVNYAVERSDAGARRERTRPSRSGPDHRHRHLRCDGLL